MRTWPVTALLLLTIPACDLKSATDALGDAGVDLDAIPEPDDIVVCDGMTLKELASANELSDSCRAAIESHLPRPETNFQGKLFAYGPTLNASGDAVIYVHGVDASGAALDAETLATASVTVTLNGQATRLAEGEFSIRAASDVPTDLLSLGIVTDYSASMTNSDLQTAAALHSLFVTLAPPLYEAEVTLFSDMVFQKQSFTTDSVALEAAVAIDDSIERESTALYDGMGDALEGLVARTRPVKLLWVSTDGLENASTRHQRSALLQTIANEGIFVIMVGALFADIAELKSLMGARGVFFYGPYFSDVKPMVERYIDSFQNLVAVTLAPGFAGAEAVDIDVDGLSAHAEP